jgi:hypothetical protein
MEYFSFMVQETTSRTKLTMKSTEWLAPTCGFRFATLAGVASQAAIGWSKGLAMLLERALSWTPIIIAR